MSHRGITIAGDGMGSRKSAQESNHTQKKQGINIGGDGMGGRKGTARDWLFGDDETEEQAPLPRRSKFTESKSAASNASSAAPVPSAAPVSSTPRAGATRVPNPAYPASDSAVLYGDKALYARIARASYEKATDLVQDFEIPIRSGKAWVVKKGQLCTLSTPYGAQVGDLNMWSLSNPRERFWAARTRQLHASHVSVGDRLWSNLPYLRPLATIVGDSLKDYGVDSVGGRVHDLLGTRCDPYVNKLLSGADFDFQCHSNLVRAVIPYGLNESDVHDVLNVFQVTGLNVDGKYFMEPSPAKPGDYFTFFAETDLLCAMSTCPGGDLSVHGWGEGAPERMLSTCKPLGVKVFELEDQVKSSVLRGWKESKSPAYKGIHGVQMPVFGQEKRS